LLVHVDVRGAYKSEGKVQSFCRVDAADGYGMIEWNRGHDQGGDHVHDWTVRGERGSG
jgi:predicted acyl esterase